MTDRLTLLDADLTSVMNYESTIGTMFRTMGSVRWESDGVRNGPYKIIGGMLSEGESGQDIQERGGGTGV